MKQTDIGINSLQHYFLFSRALNIAGSTIGTLGFILPHNVPTCVRLHAKQNLNIYLKIKKNYTNNHNSSGCMVMTMKVTCMQMALCVHKNSCTISIRLYKTKLRLSICSSLCPVRPSLPTFLVHCVVILAPLLHYANFFVCLFLQKLIL